MLPYLYFSFLSSFVLLSLSFSFFPLSSLSPSPLIFLSLSLSLPLPFPTYILLYIFLSLFLPFPPPNVSLSLSPSLGNLGSYTPDAILKRALSVVDEGVMEIWLSSEDTGAYGIDLGTSLTSLLLLLTSNLPATIMLRVGMTNPPYILSQLSSLTKIFSLPNVFSFLHVPVQSGSDSVLTGEGGMNREYTVADFEKVCDVLLAEVPGMTIATDIICGFPNETEADFDLTMKMMDKYRFGICNISQFYPRPGTPAAKMKRIDTKIVKNRSRRFSTLFNSLDPYAGMEGEEQAAWVGMESDSTGLMTVCHLKNYTKCLVPRNDDLVGCKIRVVLEGTERFHVVGRVVEGSVERMVPKVPVDGGNRVKRGRKAAGGGKEEKEKAEEEENCDKQNYKVAVEEDAAECCGGGGEGGCGGGGGGCGEGAGEEKKQEDGEVEVKAGRREVEEKKAAAAAAAAAKGVARAGGGEKTGTASERESKEATAETEKAHDIGERGAGDGLPLFALAVAAPAVLGLALLALAALRSRSIRGGR